MAQAEMSNVTGGYWNEANGDRSSDSGGSTNRATNIGAEHGQRVYVDRGRNSPHWGRLARLGGGGLAAPPQSARRPAGGAGYAARPRR